MLTEGFPLYDKWVPGGRSSEKGRIDIRASPQWRDFQKVQDMIDKAASKLASGKKKKCQKIMVKVFRKLENVK